MAKTKLTITIEIEVACAERDLNPVRERLAESLSYDAGLHLQFEKRVTDFAVGTVTISGKEGA